MRTVFLGTPEFAVPTLERLIEAGHDVVAVYTQPDRPKGRGGEVAQSPVKRTALALALPVRQPERIRRPEVVEELAALRGDVMVVVGYGQIIPQAIIDLPKMVEMLVTDKRNNPSNYSLVVLSEGSEWEGYKVKEYGEADAFGHRKKMSVAEDFSEQIKALAKEETIVSDLTYELRSGDPDFVDRMVASTFGTMALDAVFEGKSGLMAGIQNGCYAMVPIPDPKLGPRKVDVENMYNTERYRPSYTNKTGLPVFLTRA